MTGNAQGGNFFSYKRYYFNVNCKKKREREKRRYISGRQLDYQPVGNKTKLVPAGLLYFHIYFKCKHSIYCFYRVLSILNLNPLTEAVKNNYSPHCRWIVVFIYRGREAAR